MEPRPESIVSQHSAAAACVRMSTSVVDQEIITRSCDMANANLVLHVPRLLVIRDANQWNISTTVNLYRH